jgi:quinolinate synthase
MDTKIDPRLDLFEEIDRLRKEMNAVILAHYYQEGDIQDLADHVGDSLALAQAAEKTEKSVIVFAGVHFMAETAKILNPNKLVLLPSLEAGCSLADGCPGDKFAEFLKQYPDHFVISYINCSAEVKALSGLICTSSNAERMIRSVPEGTPIVFAPDQYLGQWLIKKTGREMVLWPGSCEVHEIFNAKEIAQLKVRHPDAKVAAHPECTESVLELADHIGSTSSILKYVTTSPHETFIIATEAGIIHQMKKLAPEKTFIPGPADSGCSCNECPYMKKNTLENLYLCMKNRRPEIILDEELREKALLPIERMLELSA